METIINVALWAAVGYGIGRFIVGPILTWLWDWKNRS